MAQSRGPFGGPPPSLRRRPGDELYGTSQQPAGGGGAQWPPQPQHGHGYGDHQMAPQPMPAPIPMQGHYFPASDPQPGYGYANQQMLVPQQWAQPGEPQPYEVAYHQGYPDNDPSPFAQHGGPVQQHHGYADSDMEFDGGYYEDEEPRRGKRWLLIAAALVGAIGVGGALAYTYRSIVAPNSRVAAVKSEPAVKVKVGKDAPTERAPVKAVAEPPAPKADPPAAEDPSGDGQGTRTVKVITIAPETAPKTPPSSAPVGIPGITLYQPPVTTPPPAPPVKEKAKEVQPSPGGSRVTLGTRPETPPPATEEVEETPEPPPAPPPAPPIKKAPQVGAAPKVAPPPAPKAPSGSGLGFVAVLKSEKTSMDAMKAYADLQQRYPEVLAGKSFDVQEADLSARGLGIMYRVVVGPPGSHNAASGVCAQLKAAGYVGCWVKEY